jgi:dephospho-CoA kinase
MIIGVMGMSGSGKSTFAGMLRDMGAKLIDADIVAREVVEKGTKGLSEIREAFGDEVIFPDGTLNRKKLGEIVFSDEKHLAKLNLITAPKIDEIIKKRALESEKTVVIDCPMLHKISAKDICDIIILVKAPFEKMRERIEKRDNLSEKQAEERLSSQASDFEKYADIIIENDGDIESLKIKAEMIKEKYL